MLFFLMASHALADYSLQNEAIATCKCRVAKLPLQKAVPWFYWLTAHALLHGAFVALVIAFLGSGRFSLDTAVMFGLFEFVAHWLIDLAKCEGLLSIHADQGLHVLCKVIWYGMLLAGVTAPSL